MIGPIENQSITKYSFEKDLEENHSISSADAIKYISISSDPKPLSQRLIINLNN